MFLLAVDFQKLASTTPRKRQQQHEAISIFPRIRPPDDQFYRGRVESVVGVVPLTRPKTQLQHYFALVHIGGGRSK